MADTPPLPCCNSTLLFHKMKRKEPDNVQREAILEVLRTEAAMSEEQIKAAIDKNTDLLSYR